jgi:hypothetical protein
MKLPLQKGMCIPTFIAPLFTVAMMCICKKKEILAFATTWMDLENILYENKNIASSYFYV